MTREQASDTCGFDGFTLIELSLVISIIAIVIGSILVGRDLIHAALVRAQISQIEQVIAGTNAFKLKYNGFPGDMAAAQAYELGFAARAGTPGRGDGNGRLNSEFWPANLGGFTETNYNFKHETALFWNDLGRAGLIPGEFSASADAPVALPRGSEFSEYMPTGRLNSRSYLNVWADEFGLPQWNSFHTVISIAEIVEIRPDGRYRTRPATSPKDAFAIDMKMDDGVPVTGVVGSGVLGPEEVSTYSLLSGNEPCLVHDSGAPAYNIAGSESDDRNCGLNVGYR